MGGDSYWWKDGAKIRDGVGGLGGVWFCECVAKKVGNGRNIFFLDWTLGGRGSFVGEV